MHYDWERVRLLGDYRKVMRNLFSHDNRTCSVYTLSLLLVATRREGILIFICGSIFVLLQDGVEIGDGKCAVFERRLAGLRRLLEGVGEGAHVGETLLGIFGERDQHDLVESWLDLWQGFLQRSRGDEHLLSGNFGESAMKGCG